jgi:hypothetical protein
LKLEVPHIRIMRGEAGDLSPNASKLLLILIACQDQTTSQIKWSPEALLEISKLPRSTYYRSLKELLNKSWIEKHGKSLKVSLVGQNVSNKIEKVSLVGQNVSNEIEKVSLVGQNVPPERPDQIRSIDLRSDQIEMIEINSIAEFYHLNENEINQLIEICKGKSKGKIMEIFQTMKRKEIKNPVQYLKKSLDNLNGKATIKMGFQSLPEMELNRRANKRNDRPDRNRKQISMDRK